MKLFQKLTPGIQVAGFAGLTLFIGLALIRWIGVQNPFASLLRFEVSYHFAGGVEVGSPVRVSGIKVGQVEGIQFDGDQEAPVRLQLAIDQKVSAVIRRESQFFINLAGIIGERYVEITPGHAPSPLIRSGECLRGVDPPRIDQLFSQSFNLAGTLESIIKDNKVNLQQGIALLNQLGKTLQQSVHWLEQHPVLRQDLETLFKNLVSMTTSIQTLTNALTTPEGKKSLELLNTLLWRLEPLNQEAIRSFFQKEGIRTRLF